MNINYELIQFFVYKKILKRNEVDKIIEECTKLDMPVDEYLILKEYCTEITALEAMAEFYCMPCVELDMLDIDKELLEKFSYEFLKKQKIVPVTLDTKNNKMLLAVGRPADCNALSTIAISFFCDFDIVLVPSVQIDRYIDSIVAVISTSLALSDLNSEKDNKMFADAKSQMQVIAFKEEDVINNPAVRLVDSIIKEAIPYRRRFANARGISYRVLSRNLRPFKNYGGHEHC